MVQARHDASRGVAQVKIQSQVASQGTRVDMSVAMTRIRQCIEFLDLQALQHVCCMFVMCRPSSLTRDNNFPYRLPFGHSSERRLPRVLIHSSCLLSMWISFADNAHNCTLILAIPSLYMLDLATSPKHQNGRNFRLHAQEYHYRRVHESNRNSVFQHAVARCDASICVLVKQLCGFYSR
jgi:hypothetical protein